MARDNSVLTMRRILKGNAADDFLPALTGHLRHMLDGILKVVNSLRTTMSTNGCQLVQELARTLGSSIDPMVELLMQNLMKLCSATKHIAAQNGNATVDVLLTHVSYNARLVQHVWHAVQDKNVQPRTFAAGWLRTLMRRQTHNRSQLEHSGGLELVEKSIKKGLSDANPKVRETMRGAYWEFAQIWPEKGDTVINTLDAKSRQLLEKDPANPNAPQSSFTTSVGPGIANPRATASTARSTLKDTIVAQKKAALAARRIPDRPNSAMANLSPVKEAGKPSAKALTMPNGSVSRRPTTASSSTTSHGSLMSGPVRRPKRPEISRPATADPYADRQRAVPAPESESVLDHPSPQKKPASRHRGPPQKQEPHSKAFSNAAVLTHEDESNIPESPPAQTSPSNASPPRTSPLRTPLSRTPPFRSVECTEHQPSPHMPAENATVAVHEDGSDMIEIPPAILALSGSATSLEQDTGEGRPVENAAASPLQEIGPNERHSPLPAVATQTNGHATPPTDENRSGSPSKKENATNRRILSSGIERLRAKTLDAHGFRRLQDLVGVPVDDSTRLMLELLLALIGYVEAAPETLRVNTIKAISLKSQALTTMRGVAALYKAAIEVRQEFPSAICATLVARQMVDSSPHFAADLEKTAVELVSCAGGQLGDCLNAVLDFVSRESARRGEQRERSMTVALTVLSKIQTAMHEHSIPLTMTQKQQTGKLAVRFLDDRDPDVRRADTELCLKFFVHFGEAQKDEFWSLLRGAREAQLNLIAYYMARKLD